LAGKQERQAEILSVVRQREIGTQEELRVALAARGLEVTQATLSRDLRELGLVRVPGENGSRYALPESLADEGKLHLALLLPQLFDSIDGVGYLAVLHTLASGAQPIAEAVDAEGWPEVLGTIAGENTVLIVCRSDEARTTVSRRLEQMAAS
jgi:transcriptional regulator of arginine metabolism